MLIGKNSIFDSRQSFDDVFFGLLSRQGPGSDRMSHIVASMLPVFDINARIADIQCGTGAQTKVLQETLRRHIIAADSRTHMIASLQNAVNQDPLLTNNISTLVAKPDDLPFPKNYLHLIWCENFVGPYGVDKILQRWCRWLQPEAYVVFSLCSWVRSERPGDEYINKRFGYMRQVTENLLAFEKLGFSNLGHIVQPDDCWTDNHYIPMSMKIQELPKEVSQRNDVKQFIEDRRREIQSYVQFKSYFRNVFYILQRRMPTRRHPDTTGTKPHSHDLTNHQQPA